MVSEDDIHRIRDQLNSIQKSCASTEQHLRELNGSIERHRDCLDELEDKVDVHRGYINRVEGALILLTFLLGMIGTALALWQFIGI